MDNTGKTLINAARELLKQSSDEIGDVLIGGHAFQDTETKEIIWSFEFNAPGTLYEGMMPMHRSVVEATAAGDFEAVRSWLIDNAGHIAAALHATGLELPDKIELVIGEWANCQQIKGSDKATSALKRMAAQIGSAYKDWMIQQASHVVAAEA